ncbi:hypothetical protein GCM10022243_34410 [Saccharothrix violaceirubra]|uniref:Uncharacterized protein n=1 Tax=Saccharothrix violaceirubra TaxID=413306 RepID=A0A7W7T5T2_9PSEU|nr:hypothetical protein [Saccharothrix violaceirubra]MBB4966492.1 hypothetical protein [Saccharothrix violaceirubra]
MPAATALLVRPDVLNALWMELHHPRSTAHRMHHVTRCDTALRADGVRLGARHDGPTGSGLRLAGQCPCRDLVADALEIAAGFLAGHGDGLANPAGAVRQHLRFRMTDAGRRERRLLGAQVKPGTVARNRYGTALPDDFHRALYVLIADEAGVRGPLRGEEGLRRRLADRCTAELGIGPEEARRRLPAALRLIESTCRRGPRVNVGTRRDPELVSWWDAYVERPLGRRPDPTVLTLPHQTGADDRAGAAEVRDPHAENAFDRVLTTVALRGTDIAADSPEEVVVAALRQTVTSTPPDRTDDAVSHVVTLLRDRGLLPENRARLLLDDPAHRRRVIACARALA